ncbi:MAG: tetratricopeptide repeat protein [Muribaculaceae bacterium]|nr:tetratricopeptide repeat protein [Muribaculaceae bacterium]
MRIKNILLSLGVVIPMGMSAQQLVMNTTAQGYLDRGKHMFNSRNYVGAIDQLSHAQEMGLTGTAQEEAEYYIALSKFERAENGDISALVDFVENHPTSELAQWAQLKIGDYYFYRGYWNEALESYSLVRNGSLDGDRQEDWIYRRAYALLMCEDGEKHDKAKSLYSKLKDSKRYSQAAKFFQAYIDYADGKYDEAHKTFSAIVDGENPNKELAFQSQYYIAQIDFIKEKYNQVTDLGEKLLNGNDNDYFTTELHRIVGESYYHTGNNGLARQHLNTYFDRCDEDGKMPFRTAGYALGALDYKLKDYSNTIKHMGYATDVDDEMKQSAHLYIGQSKIGLGDEAGAAQAFLIATNASFNDNVRETAFFNYAVLQHKNSKDNFGESITLFEKFLHEYPDSKYKSDVEGVLVDAYVGTNNYEKALESINALPKPGEKVLQAKQFVLYNLGINAITDSKNDEAINYLQQAVDMGAKNQTILNESRLWLAEALYRTGDKASIEKSAQQLKEYFKHAKDKGENTYKAHYSQGSNFFTLGKYNEAISEFQAALASNQLTANVASDAYLRMGDSYYYLEDLNSALDCYKRALEADKNNNPDHAMYQIGQLLALNKKYDEAVAQMDKLMEQCPKSNLLPKVLLEKGNMQAAMNNGAGAIDTYKQLVKTYPKAVEARQALMQQAIVHMGLNNVDDAIEVYKQVVKAYPKSDEAQAAVEDLKLIYADRGELASLESFLKGIKGAPTIKVDDIDRLTFEAAEKDAIDDNPSITRMQEYIEKNPNGAYVSKAKYYIARYYYFKGKYDIALTGLEDALSAGTHTSFAEDAMSMRCDILMRQKQYDKALTAYEELAEKTSSDDNRITAQLGAMRASKALNNWSEVKDKAARVLEHTNLTATEEREATMNRAIANAKLGYKDEAVADFSNLAKDTQSAQGAQAAYELANLYFLSGDLKNAEATTNSFIDAGTPHSYWLAKSFLLLSDIYAKQGKVGDARDYLLSLKDNYPGKEKDITEGIETRLEALKNVKTTTTSSKDKNKKNKKK